MDTEAHTRTTAEGHVCSFLLSREFRFVHEAVAVKAVKARQRWGFRVRDRDKPTEAALGRF
jgi:hypothetical protein